MFAKEKMVLCRPKISYLASADVKNGSNKLSPFIPFINSDRTSQNVRPTLSSFL